jgi:hypothetical protein
MRHGDKKQIITVAAPHPPPPQYPFLVWYLTKALSYLITYVSDKMFLNVGDAEYELQLLYTVA